MTDERSSSEITAAEYALGLLTGEEERAARQRIAVDPDFASEVARWRGRLAPLHDETQDVPPPAEQWDRIEAAIGGRAAANDNLAILRVRLRAWKSATAVMGAIAASLALVLVLEPGPTVTQRSGPPQRAIGASPMVAMLGDASATKVMASWDPNARQLILVIPGKMPTDERHSNELWVIPAGGKPKSLGTMPAGKQMHMRLADALADLLQQGATIAISIEPRGGSPTGAPTGPVVASGALTPA